MNDYLLGSVLHMVERGRQLCAKIPRNLPRDYDTLARTCRDKLTSILEQLRSLIEDPVFSKPQYQTERLRLFKRLVAELEIIETTGIAALDRAKEDDHQLNAMLERITREIRYPLETPVVTTLSQQYFCILTELNLLCVPLTEGRFLLHLPDLYHELAHPLLTAQDDPVVEPFQESLSEALRDAMNYLLEEGAKEDRKWGPAQPSFTIRRWEISWIKYWMVEFFCDLFAVFTLGPAFAWSHLHLVAKRGGNPFEVPVLGTSSHPADDARMRAMICGLRTAGYVREADEIGARWRELLAICGFAPEPEYHRCYPDHLIEKIVAHAQRGVQAIQCRLASVSTPDTVHRALNDAWPNFWSDPSGYVEWEKRTVEALLC